MARMLAATVATMLLATAPAHAAPAPRIIGGTQAAPGAAPYMAALLDRTRRNEFDCGGAVVAPTVVVTAAHCIEPFRAEWLLVRVGSNDLRSGGRLVRVVAAPIHQKYDRDIKANDVGVLRLAEPVSVPPIALPNVAEDAALSAPGRPVTAYGWGAVDIGTKPQRFLREGVTRVVGGGACSKSWRKLEPTLVLNQRFKVCAEGASNFRPDTCRGDSGGPLVGVDPTGRPVLLGITSFGGPKCGRPPVGIYTRVLPYEGFIGRASRAG
jgi:secreted trypsin-like serine protease